MKLAKCLECGKPVKKSSQRCPACYHKFRSGVNHPLWKNGRMRPCEVCGEPVFRSRRHLRCWRAISRAKGYWTKDGYFMVKSPDHPRANKQGYVHRSWLVMEEKLGRLLQPTEIAHHKNEIPDDDRPENLEVRTRGGHTRHHSPWKGRRPVRGNCICAEQLGGRGEG